MSGKGGLSAHSERVDPRGHAIRYFILKLTHTSRAYRSGRQRVGDLLRFAERRERVHWTSDGSTRSVGIDLDLEKAVSLGGTQYSLRYDPAWRFVVVGGHPVSLAIARLAQLSHFETIVVRPGGPNGPAPFKGVRYVRANAASAIASIVPDRWTAIVSATHDDDIDDDVTLAAFAGDPGYVGVLGTAGRIHTRTSRLQARGIAANLLDALHAPIGAVRSGKDPWEVGVSVVAQVMEARQHLLTESGVVHSPLARAAKCITEGSGPAVAAKRTRRQRYQSSLRRDPRSISGSHSWRPLVAERRRLLKMRTRRDPGPIAVLPDHSPTE